MHDNKILITGGSGFIGTNLLDFYIQRGVEVLNIDTNKPRNTDHIKYWRDINILNKESVFKLFEKFEPTHVIHLAARTDLYEKKELSGYCVNIEGVENIISATNMCDSVQRIIFTSSMLVCKAGYIPTRFDEYCPTTLYGKSKAIGEELVKKDSRKSWCIIRPTSIWGPWFSAPYLDFFKMVLSKRYFNMGSSFCTKTYGYVGNSIYQIDRLLDTKEDLFFGKTYYIGDEPPIIINEWADEISKYVNFKIPTFPFPLFKVIANFGDVLGAFKIKFPLTSFRLNNMTTNNILDLNPIYNVAPLLPHTRQEANKITIDWMVKNKIIHGFDYNSL